MKFKKYQKSGKNEKLIEVTIPSGVIIFILMNLGYFIFGLDMIFPF